MEEKLQNESLQQIINDVEDKLKKNAEEDIVMAEELPEDVEVEEVNPEDEIVALREDLDAISERVMEIEQGQDKLVSVVEKIYEQVSATPEEETSIDALVEESKNNEDVSVKNNSEEGNEVEEEVKAPEITETPAEEVIVDTPEKEETAPVEEVVEEAKEEAPVEAPAEEVEEKVEEESKVENDAEPAETENSEEEKTEEVSSVEETPAEQPAEEEKVDEEIKENSIMTEEQINDLVARIKNEIADAQVEEPEVTPAEEAPVENSVAQNWKTRYNDQVSAAWDAHRLKSVEGFKKLNAINKFNAELKAQENKIGDGPVTIDTIDGFVLPPEVDKMIHGKRTDYSAFLSALNYDQASSLSFVWMRRKGDIQMRSVKFCETGGTISDDAAHTRPDNLKPIEVPEYAQGVAQLEEMAAVTPICNAVTRFAAADILADVAASYRNDYDRKLAQLAIVRLQQAVNETDNVVEFDPATATDALINFVKATTKVSDGVVNGKFLFNAKTKAKLLEFLFNAGNGGALSDKAFTNGDAPTIFGYQYIVVPNDLMPTLGEGDTKTFTAQSLTGTLEEVEITSPVFYGDFDEFRGKIFGGLSYDVSAEASYEVYGASGVVEVRSAWQRNELVVRGSFYRGGYIADPTVIAGMEPASS